MVDTLSAGRPLVHAGPSTRVSASRWFFPVIAGGLLAVVLVGFAPTLYLRSLFDVPPIPAYLYLHGVVLTTWFSLVFVQTCLVAAHRTDLHRRLGVVAVRRLHRATMWGSLLVVMALGAVLLVVGTVTGQAVIDALRWPS